MHRSRRTVVRVYLLLLLALLSCVPHASAASAQDKAIEMEWLGGTDDGRGARVSMNYNADAATSQAMTQGSMQILAGLMDQVNASPPVLRTGSFRLTPEGWRSPTEQQAMVEGASAALTAASSLVDRVRRQIFGPRTVIIYP